MIASSPLKTNFILMKKRNVMLIALVAMGFAACNSMKTDQNNQDSVMADTAVRGSMMEPMDTSTIDTAALMDTLNTRSTP